MYDSHQATHQDAINGTPSNTILSVPNLPVSPNSRQNPTFPGNPMQ